VRTSDDGTTTRGQQVDELLRRIDAQRRQQLLLEAAGAHAPALEQETMRAREQLADLVR
jgi:hypothetical protein